HAPSPRPRDKARSVKVLAIKWNPEHTRAIEVRALAGVERASTDEGHAVLRDLARSGEEEGRDRPSAEMREHHPGHVMGRPPSEPVCIAVRRALDARELRLSPAGRRKRQG